MLTESGRCDGRHRATRPQQTCKATCIRMQNRTDRSTRADRVECFLRESSPRLGSHWRWRLSLDVRPGGASVEVTLSEVGGERQEYLQAGPTDIACHQAQPELLGDMCPQPGQCAAEKKVAGVRHDHFGGLKCPGFFPELLRIDF